MEKARHNPLLKNSGKAKAMMGQINKTDKLDAQGLALLLRNGTLPSIWIPPRESRDERELVRARMSLVRMRTMIKNRVHTSLSKYSIRIQEVSDIFGSKGLELLEDKLQEFPPHTAHCVRKQIEFMDEIENQIKDIKVRIKALIKETPDMQILTSIPGVGMILAVVIAMEVGDVNRFSGPEKLASYAGTVLRIKASGRQYLSWACSS